MLELVRTVQVWAYLNGPALIGPAALVALLLVVLILRATLEDSPQRPWNSGRLAFSTLCLGLLFALPLPVMLLLRPGADAQVTIGGILYQKNCGECHGLEGNRLPKVSLKSTEYLESLGAEAALHAIRQGVGLMPAFGRGYEGPVEEEDIHLILQYLQAKATSDKSGPSTSGTGEQGGQR